MDSYGICNLSVIPLRKEPSDKAEIGSQLLFGDAFTILKYSQDERWLYIKNAYDSYLGWIDYKQYREISQDFFELLNSFEAPLCGELIGLLHGETAVFPILLGTSLPFFKDDTVILENEVFKFKGMVHYPRKNNDFAALKMTSLYYLNTPYLWGGKCHFGIDCSGFMQQVFRFAGIKLPRDAYQQAEKGESVSFVQLKPGDLAFFNDDAGRVMHVGLILENNKIIHASGKVRIDTLEENGIYNAEKGEFSHKLHSIKRVLA
jgi:hypothetical protein